MLDLQEMLDLKEYIKAFDTLVFGEDTLDSRNFHSNWLALCVSHKFKLQI